MKAWFKYGHLQSKVGTITDQYGVLVELHCEETNEYFLRFITEIEIIK
jgi:hypothetical protein